MTRSRPAHLGFSLVELLVAMSIGTVVLLTAAAMLGRGGDDYARIGGNVGAEREARALITQITEDLRAATFHPDSVFEKSGAAWPVDRLGVFVLQPGDSQSTQGHLGDLCAVQYYLRDLTINGKAVRCLMRGFRESKDTFAAVGRGEAAGLFAPAERDEPVAFGVLAFEARPKSRDTSGAWLDWVKNTTVPPEAVEIRLVIARRETTAKLKSSSEWDGGGRTSRLLGTYENALNNKNIEVVSTLVRFGGGKAQTQVTAAER
ncbi:MAG: prepilin-type N-terminal cleavage/methylation domain-containing protein [Verrucomicrobia bacterium]|nr:prepilin-type N-terminal cleavage/methylation domain-containing protein [Verrucomicrobiota bacterium]